MGDDKELIRFGEYLSHTKGLGERTITLYLNYFRMLDLSLIEHQEYVNAFIQDHKNNSVVRGMMLNLIAYLNLQKKVDLPPAVTGRAKKRIIRSISKEEIDKLRKDLYAHSFKHGLIFDLIYQGALRRVEVPTIKINSFQWIAWLDNPKSLCKLIVLGKGNKERVVLINSETAQQIFDFYSKHKPNMDLLDFVNSDQLLFVTTSGEPMTEKMVYYVIKRGSQRYLGRDIRTHELRHHRATELESMGVPIKDIKNYLGHSNLATTEIYLHRSEKESLDTITKIINN